MTKTAAWMRRCARGLAALGLWAVLAGCATGPKLVPHAFNFNGWSDGWAQTVVLLEFRYGDQYLPTQAASRGGRGIGYSDGVNGPMPVGEFLYVKWRLKASDEVLEQRVDLRERLPRDMTDHELTFVIDGQQLYVYVVTPQDHPSSVKQRTHRTWLSRFNVAYEIYPSQEIPPSGNAR
jgi:hypothetical protein